jgi:hypothetical protein
VVIGRLVLAKRRCLVQVTCVVEGQWSRVRFLLSATSKRAASWSYLYLISALDEKDGFGQISPYMYWALSWSIIPLTLHASFSQPGRRTHAGLTDPAASVGCVPAAAASWERGEAHLVWKVCVGAYWGTAAAVAPVGVTSQYASIEFRDFGSDDMHIIGARLVV